MSRNNGNTADKVEKADGGQGEVSPNAFGFGVLGVLIFTPLDIRKKMYGRFQNMARFYLTGLALLMAFATSTALAQGAGKALDFDGSNDYVNVGNNSTLNPTSEITVEAWVYRAGSTVTGNYGIVNKEIWDEAGDDDAYNIFIRQVDNLVDFVTYTSNDPTGVWAGASTSAILLNTWTHVAGTYNGIEVAVYINGVKENFNPASGTIQTSTLPVWIGASSDDWSYFNGTIDEVRIWNVALTEAQIREWMHKTEGLTDETGLVSVWHLDESTVGSESAVDSKGSNHGTPTNMTVDDCVTSTAPFGTEGKFVATTEETSVGPAGG